MPGPTAPPPTVVGFSYGRLLGSGGFADVYLYRDTDLDRPVAIKVLRSTIDDVDTQDAFVAESKLMARVSGHPYIVQIYQNGVAPDGRPYLVMQYYPGESYAHRVRTGTLSVSETLEVGVQLASALETAHSVGIVHRDVKPSNVLTDRYGKPGLTDFGIAGAVSDGSLGFSPPYAPPEVVLDATAGDPRGDVFSLSATLYALLAGHSPFEAAGGDNTRSVVTARVLNDQPFPLDRQDVPAPLERLLVQALSKYPIVRPASALAFGRSLQAIQQSLQYAPTPLTLEHDQPGRATGPTELGEEERTRYAGERPSDPAPPPDGVDASDDSHGGESVPPADDEAIVIAPTPCAYCGSLTSEDSSFCSHCGRRVSAEPVESPAQTTQTGGRRCAHCGVAVGSTALFCDRCGRSTTLSPEAVAPTTLEGVDQATEQGRETTSANGSEPGDPTSGEPIVDDRPTMKQPASGVPSSDSPVAAPTGSLPTCSSCQSPTEDGSERCRTCGQATLEEAPTIRSTVEEPSLPNSFDRKSPTTEPTPTAVPIGNGSSNSRDGERREPSSQPVIPDTEHFLVGDQQAETTDEGRLKRTASYLGAAIVVVAMVATIGAGGIIAWSQREDATATATATATEASDKFTTCESQTSILATECAALVLLHNSTNGPDWTNSSGWVADPDPCDWHGVGCSDGSVSELSLSENQLTGPIPNELHNLTELDTLYLHGNQLDGSIPSALGDLANLTELSLARNSLWGGVPPSLGRLDSLSHLTLHGQAGCLRAAPSLSNWLSSMDPDWDDGC